MDDATLVERFEDASIPMDRWDHRAHVRVAFAYLSTRRHDQALARLRVHLRALVASFGIKEGPTRGFHETLTVAWLRVVGSAMRAYGPYANSAALLDEHPYLLDKRLMRLFYSRERIMAPEAKARFVESDLAGLPPAH